MLPVKCPECSKLISNAYNLRVHMDLHKHLTYLCSICATPTRSRDTLRKHITNIHKVKGEALREMLDHGIVAAAAADGAAATTTTSPAEEVKSEPREEEEGEEQLVVDESGAEPEPEPELEPPVVEPPPTSLARC